MIWEICTNWWLWLCLDL